MPPPPPPPTLSTVCLYIVSSTLKTFQNGEEKSLRHIAMVTKFLDDNKPKRYLTSGFALFQSSSTFNLSHVGEIFWVEYE